MDFPRPDMVSWALIKSESPENRNAHGEQAQTPNVESTQPAQSMCLTTLVHV